MATTGSTSGAAKATLSDEDKDTEATPTEPQKQGIDAQGVAPLGGIDGVPTDRSGVDNEKATKKEEEMLPQMSPLNTTSNRPTEEAEKK